MILINFKNLIYLKVLNQQEQGWASSYITISKPSHLWVCTCIVIYSVLLYILNIHKQTNQQIYISTFGPIDFTLKLRY